MHSRLSISRTVIGTDVGPRLTGYGGSPSNLSQGHRPCATLPFPLPQDGIFVAATKRLLVRPLRPARERRSTSKTPFSPAPQYKPARILPPDITTTDGKGRGEKNMDNRYVGVGKHIDHAVAMDLEGGLDDRKHYGSAFLDGTRRRSITLSVSPPPRRNPIEHIEVGAHCMGGWEQQKLKNLQESRNWRSETGGGDGGVVGGTLHRAKGEFGKDSGSDFCYTKFSRVSRLSHLFPWKQGFTLDDRRIVYWIQWLTTHAEGRPTTQRGRQQKIPRAAGFTILPLCVLSSSAPAWCLVL